jgi:hypothetical protein
MKEKDRMKTIRRLTGFKGAAVLVAILVMNGAALAKKPANNGVPAPLSADRTSAAVTVITPACDPATTMNAAGKVSVHIYQSVGRLINIGIGSGSVVCNNLETSQEITVNAIPGLAFQPGPATLVVRFTTTDLLGTDTVQESGSRIDLRP